MASRHGKRGVVAALFALLLCGSVAAQKVQTAHDKSVDFSHYKRYTWGKNFLITRQLPGDQARIDKVIVGSIGRHLQAKGFVRNDEHPDFVVVYNAGALSDVKMGTVVDISGPWGPYSPSGTSPQSIPGSTAVNVWASIAGNLQIVVADAHSNAAIWQAIARKKYRDPREVMEKLDKDVDQIVKKAIKNFPPRPRK